MTFFSNYLRSETPLLEHNTFDLVRRGQIKVARDRHFVPTNRVDPNDADPGETSFEGGSNVAEVTSAQKYNNAATIILDDGSAEENIFPPMLFPGRLLLVVRGVFMGPPKKELLHAHVLNFLTSSSCLSFLFDLFRNKQQSVRACAVGQSRLHLGSGWHT